MTTAHHLTAHWAVEDDDTPSSPHHHHLVEQWVDDEDTPLTSTPERSHTAASA
jgi:hypothetical protein